jgi:hypothetical protein
LPDGITAGRPGKPVLNFSNHVRLATQNAARPASLLHWWLGVADNSRTNRGFPAGVSQQIETVVLGICCFSSHRVMGDAKSVQSSSSLPCDAASVS